VSVIIPAYNVAPYIGEAVASVLAQTYPSFEIILVNDGSSDTPALEAALQPYLHRMNYLSQPNRGTSAARNAAIRASGGSLLAFLDADDVWDPQFLASQVSLLQQGEYDLVYANARHFGEGARPGMTSMDAAPSRGVPDLKALLDLSCHVLTSTTVVRKQVVIDAGLFDETIRRGQDFDLWVRLALRGARMGYQRTVLAGYRLRGDSLSGDELQRYDRAVNLYRIVREKLDLPPPLRSLVDSQLRALTAARQLELGKRELAAGNYPRAAELFKSAWKEVRSLRLLAARLGLAVAPSLLRKFIAGRKSP
ncbi:MAG TPA: glycosyltransferase family A protein, partial [Gemmatimonadales bacterium]|nr:glycosyltransferase family A protein [Gemmatimonadales bacterium]